MLRLNRILNDTSRTLDLAFVLISAIDCPEIREIVQKDSGIQQVMNETQTLLLKNISILLTENRGCLEKQFHNLVLILKPLKTVIGHLISPMHGASKIQRQAIKRILNDLHEIFPTDSSAPPTKHPLPFNLLELYIELGVIAFKQNDLKENLSISADDLSQSK